MHIVLRLVIFIFIFEYVALSQGRTLSRRISCSKDQTVCTVESSRITIGDRVAFFNNSGEVIAYGEVKSISKGLRVVQITESFGRISSGFRVDLVENPEQIANLKTVSPPVLRRFGGSFGLGGYNFSGRVNTYEAMGFYEWLQSIGSFNLPQNLGVFVSGGYLTGTKSVGIGVTAGDFSMSGFVIAPGISYTLFSNSPLKIRTHFNLGGALVNADVDGDKKYNDTLDLNIKVEPGFNLYSSGKISGIYKLGKWNPEGGFYISWLGKALGSTIFLGVVAEL